MNFKEYMALDEGFANKFVMPGLLAAAGIGATYGGRTLHTRPDSIQQANIQKTSQQPVIQQNDLKTRKKNLINYIKATYNIDVDPSQITFKKPWDVIKTYYGNDSNKVYNSVFKNQTKDDTSKKVLLMASKINKLVPVIYDDANKYTQNLGMGEMRGFCHWDNNKNPYCVIGSDEDGSVISHEIGHATQAKYAGKTLIFSDEEIQQFTPHYQKHFKYMLEPREFGARLASLKRQYYQLTKNIISDEQSALRAIEHLIQNKEEYSRDVQELNLLINDADGISDGKERIAKAMAEYLPKLAGKIKGNNSLV